MSRDQLSSGSFGGRSNRPNFLGLKPDEVEATRLAELLAASESGHPTDIDLAEEPTLAGLAETANVLRLSLEAASMEASFQSFHERSRSRVLAATPRSQRVPAVSERRDSLLQRWGGLFTSVTAAGAAAVATFVVTIIAVGGGSSISPVTTTQSSNTTPEASALVITPAEPARVNLTTMSTAEQVQLWRQRIAHVQALTSEGQAVDEPLLRDLADVGASVSQRIKEDPSTQGTDAYVAWHAGWDAQQALEQATVDEDSEAARATAQSTSSDAMVVAAQYLTPDRMPLADDVAKVLGTDADATPAASEDDADAAEDEAAAADETTDPSDEIDPALTP